jgi:hypothetical protein
MFCTTVLSAFAILQFSISKIIISNLQRCLMDTDYMNWVANYRIGGTMTWISRYLSSEPQTSMGIDFEREWFLGIFTRGVLKFERF